MMPSPRSEVHHFWPGSTKHLGRAYSAIVAFVTFEPEQVVGQVAGKVAKLAADSIAP